MSNPNVILPATGGGCLLIGLFYCRFFLGLAAILLVMAVWGLARAMWGQSRMGAIRTPSTR